MIFSSKRTIANFLHFSPLQRLRQYCQARSLAILAQGTGGSAIELLPAIVSAHFDLERFGVRLVTTPQQADVLLVTGALPINTFGQVIRCYEQMLMPKYIIGLEGCSIRGGHYGENAAIVKELDRYLPVNLWVTGCLSFPEALLHGIGQLKVQIEQGKAAIWQNYYQKYDDYFNAQQQLLGHDWQPTKSVWATAQLLNQQR